MYMVGKKWQWGWLAALVIGLILALIFVGTLLRLPHLRGENQRAAQRSSLQEISHHTYGDLLARSRHAAVKLSKAACVTDLLLGREETLSRPLGHTKPCVSR